MIGNRTTVERAHDLFDQIVAKLLDEAAKAGERIPCKRGCFWCCFEPVYVVKDEAELIVSRIRLMPSEEQARIAAAVRTAIEKLKQSGLLDQKQPHVMAYRKLKMPCPLLKNGECSVYSSRPIGCRAHIARRSSDGCEHDGQRMLQEFITAKGFCDPPMHLMLQEHDIEMDHLVVWLDELLNGTVVKTASRSAVVIEDRSKNI